MLEISIICYLNGMFDTCIHEMYSHTPYRGSFLGLITPTFAWKASLLLRSEDVRSHCKRPPQ